MDGWQGYLQWLARAVRRWRVSPVAAIGLIFVVGWAAFWVYWLLAAFSVKRGRVPWARELRIRLVIVAAVLAACVPLVEAAQVRDRLAQLYIEAEVLRLNAYRGLTAIMRDGVPGPEGSLGKWQWAEVNQALTELAMDLRGPRAVLYDDTWTFRFLRARANSIEGGTTEILKNIVAERVLGLPRMR